ncbi:MAG TPA: LCP family protein [Acidimicrobiales bacterium]|nr:LCP family protein [Acidimicrobiales bacterium]
MPRPPHRRLAGGGAVRLERYRSRGDRNLKWLRPLLSGLALLLVVALLSSAFYVGYARWRFDQIAKPRLAGLTPRVAGRPFDVLFVGAVPEASPTATTAGGARAEAVIVARIVPSSGEMALLSIPTDTVVQPSHGRATLPAQTIDRVLESGPETLLQTVERDFHLPLSDYVAVDLGALPGLVAALGGLSLHVPYALHDTNAGLSVDATGCVRLDGEQAAALLASRNLLYYDRQAGGWQNDEGGASSAAARANGVFAALSARLGGLTTSPGGLFATLGALPASLVVDPSITESALYELGRALAAGAGAARATVLPTSATANGAAARPATAKDRAVLSAFLAFGSASSPPLPASAAAFDPVPC